MKKKKAEHLCEMVVRRIQKQADRILLYGEDERYHLIAGLRVRVKVGDTVLYRDVGVNFGDFVMKKP